MIYDCSVTTGSLYIHWPFCPYKCDFCPFVAIAGQDRFMERYHSALMKEMQIYGNNTSSKQALETIFLGGGTPSTWPDNLLLDMFGTLRKMFAIAEHTEISIEVNPGTVRSEQLLLWKSIGINRLSIGVQSLKDSVLSNLNRKQSSADVFWVIEEASKSFGNISIDLILGLPGMSSQEWKDLLQQIVQWPIKHVSIYFLTVHEETLLFYRVQKKEVNLTSDDTMVELYQWSVDFLQKHGLMQYEISNFARDGYHSRHNSVYWDRRPYKGIGLGACSFDGKSRFQNQKHLMKYMNDIDSGSDVTIFSETLTDNQVYLERVMLGLRRAQGLDIHDLMKDLNETQQKTMRESIAMLQEHNFLKNYNNRIILTAAGLAVQNDIAARLSL
jgi:putative oxygen-independent coproporphyrinogen III oxidase